MLNDRLNAVRNASPLVHCITNYVTVNDCANILLACSGSPIMADAQAEVEEITSICGALVINIGTLNERTIPSMLLAGKKSNELGHPVLLDPVGAGASRLRTDTALELMDKVRFTVIRGNISEIKALSMSTLGGSVAHGSVAHGSAAHGSAACVSATRGVDADVADRIDEATLSSAVYFAKRFAKATGSIIAITGAIDIVCDSTRAFIIRNGHPMMSRITGSGCMLSAMMTAYLAANPNNALEAAAAATCAMGLCGERALARLGASGGSSTYRDLLIDEIYLLDGETLEQGAKYEIR